MIKTGAKRILVAEDDEAIRSICHEVLSVAGHEVVVARDGAEALEAAGSADFDLVISDYLMPRMDGIDLYRAVVSRDPRYRRAFLFITGDPGRELEGLLHTAGLKCLVKPFRIRELLSAAEAALAASCAPPAGCGVKRAEDRVSLTTGCLISLDKGDRVFQAMTADLSCRGVKALYSGEPLAAGSGALVSLSLGGIRLYRGARVVWSDGSRQRSASGLAFIEPVPEPLLREGGRPARPGVRHEGG